MAAKERKERKDLFKQQSPLRSLRSFAAMKIDAPATRR
jgi:hypothetical protein